MRVPFSFVLTGGGDKYGTFFSPTDDAFGSTSELNGVLAAVVAASRSYADFGIYLPPTNKAYRITKVHLESDDADDDISFGIYDGTTAVSPLAKAVNGGTEVEADFDFGPSGITVASGYIPFLEYHASSGNGTITGWVEWEKIL